MPDVKVNVPGTGSGHLDYPVPGGVEFVLRQAFARYNGAGAGSAWLPAVQLIGPDGNVAGEYITGSTVAAGGSADVTFAPFLKGRVTAAGGSLSGGYAELSSFNTATFATLSNPIPWQHFSTTDNTIFQTGDAAHTINNAPGDTMCWVYGTGWYQVWLAAQWSGGAYNRALTLGTDSGGGPGGSAITHGLTADSEAASSTDPLFAASLWTLDSYIFWADGSGNGGAGARFLTSDNTQHLFQVYMALGYTPTPNTFASIY